MGKTLLRGLQLPQLEGIPPRPTGKTFIGKVQFQEVQFIPLEPVLLLDSGLHEDEGLVVEVVPVVDGVGIRGGRLVSSL